MSYQPHDAMRDTGRWTPPVLLILAIATGIILAVTLIAWQAGWWFRSQDISREAHAIRNGYANQQTLRDQITAKIADVDSVSVQITQAGDPSQRAALKGQRMAIAGIVCSDASQVTGDPLPAQQQQWVSANCQAGVVRPGSAYDSTGS
jgi:hypothetical protein